LVDHLYFGNAALLDLLSFERRLLVVVNQSLLVVSRYLGGGWSATLGSDEVLEGELCTSFLDEFFYQLLLPR
jgi:hypothetical protein